MTKHDPVISSQMKQDQAERKSESREDAIREMSYLIQKQELEINGITYGIDSLTERLNETGREEDLKRFNQSLSELCVGPAWEGKAELKLILEVEADALAVKLYDEEVWL
jgi:hypothetical protein